MKLFGKALFDKRTSEYLYDFAQHGLMRGTSNYTVNDYVTVTELATQQVYGQTLNTASTITTSKTKKEAKKPKELTPKEVYELRTLNDDLQIVCDPQYLDDNIKVLHSKLGLLPSPPKKNHYRWPWLGPQVYEAMPIQSGATGYGRQELNSMIVRLNNRRAFKSFEKDFGKWPYTTTEKLSAMLKQHPNLEANVCRDTIPDLPKEAVREIEGYNRLVDKLCQKRAIYYLVVEKKQAVDTARRRDPILLAQSPFGFFWQILGAWDKEVVYLEEL